MVDLKTLQEDLVLPAHAISNTMVSKPSLEGFVKASTSVPTTSQTDKVKEIPLSASFLRRPDMEKESRDNCLNFLLRKLVM